MNTITQIRPVDLAIVEKEINDLRAAYPEIAEDEQLHADMIEGSTNLSALLEILLETVKDAQSMRAAIALRVQDLDSRDSKYGRRIEGARKLILRLMENAGVKRFPLAEATLSVANTPPSVQIVDEEQIPEQFWREKVTRSVDKKALKEALQDGVTIGGAYMGNGGQSLRIL